MWWVVCFVDFGLTGGVKTKEWTVSSTPYPNQQFSQKEHEQHQQQLQGRPQEVPKNQTSSSETSLNTHSNCFTQPNRKGKQDRHDSINVIA